MNAPRRVGSETSKTRGLLVDVAEQIMVDEGFAAVTSRRVAARAGVNPALVHYYFPTIEDLFLAVCKRRYDRAARNLREVFETSAQPLWALWDLSCEGWGAVLGADIIALAHHRKAISAELSRAAGELRQRHIEAVSRVWTGHQRSRPELNPTAFVVLVMAVSHFTVQEELLGLTVGHADIRALVETYIEQIEGPRNQGLGTTS
jgi:TetR/AcrR family transcriptional regulator